MKSVAKANRSPVMPDGGSMGVYWKPRVPDLVPKVSAPRVTSLSWSSNCVPVAHSVVAPPFTEPNQQRGGTRGAALAERADSSETELPTTAAVIKSLGMPDLRRWLNLGLSHGRIK